MTTSPPAPLIEVHLRGFRARMDMRAHHPLDALGVIRGARVMLDMLERKAVMRARAAGSTWDDIANELKITRQSAWAKHHKHDDRRPVSEN